MPRKATTVRLAPETQDALTRLSELLHRPMNQLVNEAVRDFVARRSREVESDLEYTLAQLRALRAQDPDFAAARKAWVDAEAAYEDPLEGELVTAPQSPDRRQARHAAARIRQRAQALGQRFEWGEWRQWRDEGRE